MATNRFLAHLMCSSWLGTFFSVSFIIIPLYFPGRGYRAFNLAAYTLEFTMIVPLFPEHAFSTIARGRK